MTDTTEETTEDTAPAAYVGAGLTTGQIIAARTTDTDEDSAEVYTKVFVMAGKAKPTEDNGVDHSANKAATREFAIQNGLRPTGDVTLKSIKRNADPKAWDVTYTVPVALTETVDGPSEGSIVTQGKDAPANTDGNAGGEEPTDVPPTKSANRATIDAYAAAHGVDTTGAATKAEALALIKPTE